MADKADKINWEQQAKQFQAELDRVNPLLDAARARVGELEAQAQLAAKEKADLEAKAAEREARYTDYCTRTDQALADKAAAIVKQDRTIEAMQQKLDIQAATIDADNAAISKLQTAVAQKNAALAPCLKSVADQLTLLQAAIAAGE
jgi:chromosome segregation ATPase